MKIRHLGVWAFLGLTALSPSPPAEAAPAGPSLVLVTIDTLRADRLGCYGYHRDTSPNLDAFAEESILFERAYTTMATTLPAHASLMTSTYPLTHRVQANVAFIPRSLDDAASLRTLAEVLAGQGYETAAFVSAAPLKRHSGIDRGFETFSQPSLWQRSATKTTKRALRWLSNHSETPFFLWVHYFDPHWPYSPPKEFRDRFGDTPRLMEYLEEIGVTKNESSNAVEANEAYDGEILYTDSEIGRLFARLKKRGLWHGSIVVVTADHGEGMGQHDWMYHGKIFNEQLRVPLMIKLPGMTEGRRVERVTSLVDVLPVLTAGAGLPVPEDVRRQFQGIDVLASEAPRELVLSERVHRDSRAWGPGPQYALTSEGWKFFHAPEEGDALYDLRQDPHETRNVIEDHPEVASRMLATLTDWIAKQSAGPKDAPEIDEKTLEQLRSLGYVD